MRNAALVFASALLAAALTLFAYRHWVSGPESDRLRQDISALEREQQRVRHTIEESHDVLEAANDRIAARIREDLQAAATMRVAMVEYYQTNGRMPARQDEVGLPAPESYRGKTLRSATVLPDGVIELVFDAASGVDGGRVRLIADTTRADSMGVRWRCETSDYPNIRHVSSTCEYQPHVPKIAAAAPSTDH